MRKLSPTCAIILTAGQATRISPVTKGLPKALVRIGGRPVLLTIMTRLIQQDIRHFILVISPHSQALIDGQLKRSFATSNVKVEIVEQLEPLGPGHALACATQAIGNAPILVILADTLFDEELPLEGDWIGVAPVNSGEKWCLVESTPEGLVTDFHDKSGNPCQSRDAAVGLYHFSDAVLLRHAANLALSKDLIRGEHQISSILREYGHIRPFQTRAVNTWMDCGDLDSLIQARRNTFRTRGFNRIVLDKQGILTKSSSESKFADELRWYEALSQEQRLFVPRIVKQNIQELYVRMEHLDMPTLAELYLYDDLSPIQLAQICSDLLNTMQNVFWPLVGEASTKSLVDRCRSMYIEKMIARFQQWQEVEAFRDLSEIQLNGEWVMGPRSALAYLTSELSKVATEPVAGFIHGDFHFSNILYSLHSGCFRLIDPRGNFAGPAKAGGDIRYDIAKLRHSYHGFFDAIIHDLFIVEKHQNKSFSLSIFTKRSLFIPIIDGILDDLGFDLNSIMLIEVSLFISMLPLHSDSPKRQLAFLLQALRLLTACVP